MSFYGLNRSALNGSVVNIVAGAALLVASCTLAADGTRTVLPSATITSTSDATADGVRVCLGGASFVTTSSISAFPALLFLQTADIVSTSSLHASYTDAYAVATSSGAITGTITRPGAALSSGVCSLTVTPLVTAGFASNIVATSFATADPSVKLNGQTTWQRDGYSQITVTSSVAVDALKTAQGYANSAATSSCTADALKTHGGQASISVVASVTALPSTDSARFNGISLLTAAGIITTPSSADISVSSTVTAYQTVTIFATPIELTGISSLVADGRLAALGDVPIDVSSSGTANGAIWKLASAFIDASSILSSIPGYLQQGAASITSTSQATAFGATNAEAPDPDIRTMRRPFVDRVMRRPFVDRTMRRPV